MNINIFLSQFALIAILFINIKTNNNIDDDLMKKLIPYKNRNQQMVDDLNKQILKEHNKQFQVLDKKLQDQIYKDFIHKTSQGIGIINIQVQDKYKELQKVNKYLEKCKNNSNMELIQALKAYKNDLENNLDNNNI
jgi:parvulin-like peptidyl-prolyl isomerase